MGYKLTRRACLGTLGGIAATPLTSCVNWIRYEDVVIEGSELGGRTTVEWYRSDVGRPGDYFIYRPSKDEKERLTFKPSFMGKIVPEDIFTDGGSIPRALWGIPGLSPWGLGPAYVIHDWIFEVHRCNHLDSWHRRHPSVPDEVKHITFEQSALILAQVGKNLIEHGLAKNYLLEDIIWAVQTRYARGLWDQPGDETSCQLPPDTARLRVLRTKGQLETVVDFNFLRNCGKADISGLASNVRFWHKADIG